MVEARSPSLLERVLGRDEEPDEATDRQILSEYIKRRLQESKDREMYRSRAHRELETLRQAKVYTTCLVRVNMPSRAAV